jgi:hypothetical protein
MRYGCGGTESDMNNEQWWEYPPQSLAFTAAIGDCMRLDKIYYCVEKVEPGESVSLRATYKQVDRHHEHLERIREE